MKFIIKKIAKHFLGIQRIIENKILLNTIYLILITFFFLIIILIGSFLKKNFYPNLNESFLIECIVWFIPTFIILILSIYVIKSSIYLNPLNCIYNNIKPLILEMVSLNWKWMIIFPKQKILVFNEFCLPTNIPIKIYLISNSIMNSLCIPKVGCQLYCMTNYKKSIYILLLKHGLMHGITSNFSGIGSSYMRISIFSLISKNFFFWIKKIKSSNKFFDFKNYNKISKFGIINNPKFFNIRNNKIFFLIQKKNELK